MSPNTIKRPFPPFTSFVYDHNAFKEKAVVVVAASQ